MTIRQLQLVSSETRGRASREYVRARVTGVRREMERETDAEIRAAIAQSLISNGRGNRSAS